MSTDPLHDEADLLAWAEGAHAAGLCVLPPREDGSKQPDAPSWTRFQSNRSTLAEIRRWYGSGQRTGMGYVCGAVSDHLELFEFDDITVYQRFLIAADDVGLTPLADRIRTGYEEATPGDGIHWFYRLTDGGAKTVTLASRPGVDRNGRPATIPLIETKGEGGYVVAAPSHGSVHPSGTPYRLLSGSVETIAAITEAERDALWSLARTFDKAEPRKAERASYRIHSQENATWIVRPGDAFAAAVDWDEILEPPGWEPVRQRGESTLWRRPGGYPGGWGASTNYKGTDLLHVFTTAAPPLQPNTTYGKFAAFTWLNHEGDFKEAARALEAQGYGERRAKPTGPSASSGSSSPPDPAPLAPVPPFPLDALPPAAREYVQAGAAALGCPVDFIAPHVFAFCGAVAGTSRKLQIKQGFVVSPIFWTGVVGKPGTVKTPALNHARKPLDLLQRAAWNRWQEAYTQWEGEKPNERGRPPKLEHIFATDTTTEAVAAALAHSRGLAVIHDELAGWVKAFDAYRKAGDRQTWLSAWSGSPLKPNRKTGDPIYIPDPVVCVTGGIQPDVLPDLAGEAARNDGFLPRLLLVWPDAEPQPWTDAVVSERIAFAMTRVVHSLRLPEGEEPVVTQLSPEAYAEWVGWYNENQIITGQARGLLAGWAAKAPVHLARIALVLHLLAHADRCHQPVSGDTMRDAIAIVEYFRTHLGRILPAFGAPVTPYRAGISARIVRVLSEYAPSWISRTELSHRLGGHDTTTAITAALELVEQEGRVERRMVSTGGRAREEWRLTEASRPADDCGNAKEAEEAEELPEPDEQADLLSSSSAFPHHRDDETTHYPDKKWETWEEAV
jgi:hypothetical protein